MSRYEPHQGDQERARRRRQAERAAIKAGLPRDTPHTFWSRARVRRAVRAIYGERHGAA